MLKKIVEKENRFHDYTIKVNHIKKEVSKTRHCNAVLSFTKNNFLPCSSLKTVQNKWKCLWQDKKFGSFEKTFNFLFHSPLHTINYNT